MNHKEKIIATQFAEAMVMEDEKKITFCIDKITNMKNQNKIYSMASKLIRQFSGHTSDSIN